MQKYLIPGLFLLVASLLSCHSPHQTQTGQRSPKKSAATVNLCETPIKYHSDKIKAGSEYGNFNTDITIDPDNKRINISADPPGQEHVNFDIVIESSDCDLSTDLKSGQAVYHGHINNPDGHQTPQIIRLSYTDDGLTFTNADPTKPGEMIIIVSTWQALR